MKTFAEFNKEEKTRNVLSWKHSTFAELRNDKSYIKENFSGWFGSVAEKKTSTNKHGVPYDATHDEGHLKPSNFTKEHEDAIKEFSSTNPFSGGASVTVNSYLRNRAVPEDHPHKTLGILSLSEDKVKDAIKRLSSAFSPENTNKKNIIAYSGIPPFAADELKTNRHHSLAAFTSSSTDPRIAERFARVHRSKSKTRGPLHVMKLYMSPGTGLSLAHHSEFPEDEILIHHGQHVEYVKSTTHTNEKGEEIHVHHVVVHRNKRTLDQYGPYTKP